jgi:alginate O-acetyltransferase complex protein AlgI
MIFSSWDFFFFFMVTLFAIHWTKSNTFKKGILLISSYYFYAYWDYRFVFLMFVMSLVNYHIGIKIEKCETTQTKKNWLICSVIFNLTILGFFKYFNFFITSANTLLTNLHFKMPLLDIILPIGISFITFEVMSYVIDIYRGHNKSAATFWDLALLVAFFPHLVAGPILKPSHFLPQLEKDIIIKWQNIERGLQIFVLGLFKKIIIADQLALFVDPVFQYPSDYSSTTIWLAVIAYTIQIYCDFSGYTDMAIGAAKCLGFEIPNNFNMPYISRNITEFWRRWHISLSTWLRDYLYVSLGGNRRGKMRQYINLIIVMLLGGLWHGASWNFVVWGGLHGIALAVHKLYSQLFKTSRWNSRLYDLVCWLVTFIFVCVAWVFFRSSSFETSWYIIRKMFYLVPPVGIQWYAASLLSIIPLMVLGHYLGTKREDYYLKLTSFPGLVAIIFILFGIIFFAPINTSPFIYFQF